MADVLGCGSEGYRSAWKEGTLLDDIVNPGFPFTNLWEEHPPENRGGYTHREST